MNVINLINLPWGKSLTTDMILHPEWNTYRISNEYADATLFICKQWAHEPELSSITVGDDMHYLSIYTITCKSTNHTFRFSSLQGSIYTEFLQDFNDLYFANNIVVDEYDNFINIFESIWLNLRNTIIQVVLPLSTVTDIHLAAEKEQCTIHNIINIQLKGT